MLVQTIKSASHMRDEFQRYGRKDQFSYNAYDYLFDYLWDLAEGCAQPIEFDVIAICCEWGEYDSAEELCNQYGTEQFPVSLEDLEVRGTLIRMDGGGVLFSE